MTLFKAQQKSKWEVEAEEVCVLFYILFYGARVEWQIRRATAKVKEILLRDRRTRASWGGTESRRGGKPKAHQSPIRRTDLDRYAPSLVYLLRVRLFILLRPSLADWKFLPLGGAAAALDEFYFNLRIPFTFICGPFGGFFANAYKWNNLSCMLCQGWTADLAGRT